MVYKRYLHKIVIVYKIYLNVWGGKKKERSGKRGFLWNSVRIKDKAFKTKHTIQPHVVCMSIFWFIVIYVHCIYRTFFKLQKKNLRRKRLFHINQTTGPIHTSVFQPLKQRVTFFHFLSMLFLDCCVCVQNNKLHDAVLVRGNAEPPSQSEENMFSTCCGFFFAVHFME